MKKPFVLSILVLLLGVSFFLLVEFYLHNKPTNPQTNHIFIDNTKKSNLPVKARSKGVSFADFNNDGNIDIFYSLPYEGSKLFQNMGDVTFQDVTITSGIKPHPATSSFFVDIDNDGDLDLFINEIVKDGLDLYSKPVLYLNTNFHFIDATSSFGLDDKTFRGRGTATFGDIDNDGFLDVFLVYNQPIKQYNFQYNESAEDTLFALEGKKPIEIIPSSNKKSFYAFFQGTVVLLKNMQGSKLIDFSHALPELNTTSAFWQPLFLDYNQDSKMDIFISTDYGHPLLLKNVNGQNFKDVSKISGFEEDAFWMSGDIVDINGDTKPDIYSTNVRGDGIFISSDKNTYSLLTKINRNSIGWGGLFLDYDNDGDQDIFACNGDFLFSFFTDFDNNKEKYGYENFTREDFLYENINNTFIKKYDIFQDTLSCQGAAIADVNNDGFVDLLVGNEFFIKNEASKLYINQGNTNHWIKIKLKGVKSNTYGVGASISITSAGVTQTQYVSIGHSFLSQSDFKKIFGIPIIDGNITITVRWPSDTVQTFTTDTYNTEITVQEASD